ncbi:DUF370 domain-containing protein [bacterium]|nr:DUF370 domain-containing protein [bacterium]
MKIHAELFLNTYEIKMFLSIGFKNKILTHDIIGIFSYKITSYLINSELLERKKREDLIVEISKKEKKSLILLKDGRMIVSPIDIKTLNKRSFK